jgi:hypothetical protein
MDGEATGARAIPWRKERTFDVVEERYPATSGRAAGAWQCLRPPWRIRRYPIATASRVVPTRTAST